MVRSSGGVQERRRLVEETPEQETEPGGALGTGQVFRGTLVCTQIVFSPSSSVVATTSGTFLGPVPTLLKA